MSPADRGRLLAARVPRLGAGSLWIAAAIAACLYALTIWIPDRSAGLVRTIVANADRREILDVRRVAAIDLEVIGPAPDGRTGLSASWDGAWEVEEGFYDLRLESRGRSSWTIDGVLAVEAGTGSGGLTRLVRLTGGLHHITIGYDVDASAPQLSVTASRTGGRQEPLARASLETKPPRNLLLRHLRRALGHLFAGLTLVAIALAMRATARQLIGRWRRGDAAVAAAPARPRAPWAGRALTWSALAAILVHGALLRLDAITARYGTVSSPALVVAVQTRTIAPPRSIRPESMIWDPEPLYPHRDGRPTHYRSDPYTYLEAARTMTSFYRAHFREPVFPFGTKIALGLLNGQDVAVSFASACFSVLAIWFTYLVGAEIWSRPVGLVAALGVSLDSYVVSLSSLGWRDDAYMAAVALSTWAVLRWWSANDGGSRLRRIGRWPVEAASIAALAVGVAGGLAILTRIMAVAFLAAVIGSFLIVRPSEWRRRVRQAALVVAAGVAVAAPYFVNCWRVYGDPLYTFNVHGAIYSAAEGRQDSPATTASYVRRKIVERPLEALDTVLRGVTTYPFENKWHGLDSWLSGLGRWASIAALAGLVVLAASARGRLLVVVALASLAPFSFTWTIDPDYRFTEHVYPILLIASGVGLAAAVTGLRIVLTKPRHEAAAVWRQVAWTPWLATVGASAVVLGFIGYASGPLASAEALRHGDDVSLVPGLRDGGSFGGGWSEVLGNANVPLRVMTDAGELTIRLPAAADYPATLRMDPFPAPMPGAQPARLPQVEVAVNGVALASVSLGWTPGRVGAYEVVLPRRAVRRGANRLTLRVSPVLPVDGRPVHPGLTDGAAAALWLVRIHPAIETPR